MQLHRCSMFATRFADLCRRAMSTRSVVDPQMHPLLRSLHARDLLYDATSTALWGHAESNAESLTSRGSIGCYVGFDPTAESLHLGNLLALMALRHCQLAGLQPIALIGGATARIGDPSGRDSERPMMSEDILQKNQDGITKCLRNFLATNADGSSGKLLESFITTSSPIIVNNYDWFRDLSSIDFVRNIGRSFRVGNMLAKDAVKNRLTSENGISFTEFSYQLFQAYDFYHLFNKYNCQLQFGGSDQWGNIVAGCHYVQQVTGNSVYGFTIPLLTTSDGKKFGKSAGNAIWLDSEKTSPYHLYQYFLQTNDQDVEKFLKLFTFLSLDETLAAQVTKMIHGDAGLDLATKATRYLFEGVGFEDLTSRDLYGVFHGMISASLPESQVVGRSLLDVAVEAKFVQSKGELRRLITAGGVYLRNKKVGDVNYKVAVEDIISAAPSGKLLVVRIGKRSHHVAALHAPQVASAEN